MAGPFGPAVPTAAPAFSSGLPDLAPLPKAPVAASETGFDALSRMVGQQMGFGSLKDVPVLGDLVKGVGTVANAAINVATGVTGFGVSGVVGGASDILGRIPSNIGDASQPLDIAKYPGTPQGAFNLIKDSQLGVERGPGGISGQFLALGQWMNQHDPQALADWKTTLAEAQKQTGIGSNAGDIMTNFIRKWGTTYADETPNGVSGILDVAPELSMSLPGSFGQGLADSLKLIMVPQRMAERGAGAFKESPLRALFGDQNVGGRVEEILASAPADRSDVEQQMVTGLQEKGWTKTHAMNFLIDHGQGYGALPGPVGTVLGKGGSEMVLGMALDPVMVASLGAAGAAQVGERVAAYTANAADAGRIMQAYRAGAKAIGTTVAAVRDGPTGPAFRVARALVDPIGAAQNYGPQARAVQDVFSAVGVRGTEKAFGSAAVASAGARAAKWGVPELYQSALGTTAMNFARKFVAASHVTNMMAAGALDTARQVIPEELLAFLGHNAAGDAVSRLAGFVTKHKTFWLSDFNQEQLVIRVAKMVGQTADEIRPEITAMTSDERALWHAMSYSAAWTDYVTAVRAVPQAAWGSISKRLNDMVILNPAEIDSVAAQVLRQALDEAKTVAEKAAIWNEAAGKYTAIDNFGRMNGLSPVIMERRVSELNRLIEDGNLHAALGAKEVAALPEQFKTQFLGKWVDADGNPIWRLGFKPRADQATGLVHNADGNLVPRFDPNIDNLADALPVSMPASVQIQDRLGRVIGTQAAATVGRGVDSLETALRTATDSISGERLILSMEQKFRARMRSAGFPDKVARDVFRVSRKASQDMGVTIAGLTPDKFWIASVDTLRGLVDAEVAKRDIFAMLADAAGGDMRTLGLSPGLTQRIRSSLIARGLDPNNYLGQVTVGAYNMMRYVLNPLFFVQIVTDAPWFNMFRGVMPVGGGKLVEGTPLYEMNQVMQAFGSTSPARYLQMDYIERAKILGWQSNLREGLTAMPGVQEGLTKRLANWTGQMEWNNQLAFINSRVGDTVFDALKRVKAEGAARAAASTTPEERALWERALPQENMLASIRDDLLAAGKPADDSAVGRAYIAQMTADSRLEVRTPEGLLDYKRVNSAGAYHVPANVGELRPLDLEYLPEAVSWPNVHTEAQLRAAVAIDGDHTVAELRDALTTLGYHPDQIKRSLTALTFNWRSYFDGLRPSLGMSSYEMSAVEDIISHEANLVGMTATDFLTQVIPMAKRGGAAAADLEDHVALVLNTLRLAKKGEAGLEDLTKLVTANLQPSMREHLLDSFLTQTPAGQVIGEALKTGEVAQAGAAELGRALSQPEFAALRDRGQGLLTDLRNAPSSPMMNPRSSPEYARTLEDAWTRVEKGPWGGGTWDAHTGQLVDVGPRAVYKGAAENQVESIAKGGMHPGERNWARSEAEAAKYGKVIYRANPANVGGRAAELADPTAALSGSYVQPRYLDVKMPGEAQYSSVVPDAVTGEGPFTGAVGSKGQSSIPVAGITKAKFKTALNQFVRNNKVELERADHQIGVFRNETTGQIEFDVAATVQSRADAEALQIAVSQKQTGGWYNHWAGPQGEGVYRPHVPAAGHGTPDFARFGTDARGNATVPAAFRSEPGYVYRTVSQGRVSDNWRVGEYAAGHPATIYSKGDRSVVLRTKKDGLFEAATSGVNASDNVRATTAITADQVEVLRADGTWAPAMGATPTWDATAEARFRDLILQRASGVPIDDPIVEASARFFSKYLQEAGPSLQAGDLLKGITDKIPVAGASPFHQTQAMVINMLADGIRTSEKDALRLAQMAVERTALDRSLNHPMFGLYPSSYMWGKVLPETVRFIAKNPFGIKTGAGVMAYAHMKQTIDLQSQYDDSMKSLYDALGKSAVLGLLSYATPSMPWEDMRAGIPPWLNSAYKGIDLGAITKAELDMMSPERWVKKLLAGVKEAGGAVRGLAAPSPSPQQSQLQQVVGAPVGPVVTPKAPGAPFGPTSATGLGPVLAPEMDALQQILAGQ